MRVIESSGTAFTMAIAEEIRRDRERKGITVPSADVPAHAPTESGDVRDASPVRLSGDAWGCP